MRLNGWQRLWIVVVVVWLIAVCAMAALMWPDVKAVSHGAVYAEMVAAREHRHGAVFADFRDGLREVGVTPPRDTPLSFDPRAGTPDEAPYDFEVEIAGHELRASSATAEEDLNRAARAYAAGLQRALSAKRRAFVLSAAAVWLLPVGAIYLLGWSLAWIRRGFR